ncbi:hypothetical protein J2Z40_003301 [Cytobacillus eiseniae]|uniref:Uncharacterized protein n=1 Tax=Cytobacillus eiseniae TaxID=762947 RepID=A0ABS4RIM9_9BACI|nr:hypothetical protein [Cytobacillus eiseniae]
MLTKVLLNEYTIYKDYKVRILFRKEVHGGGTY